MRRHILGVVTATVAAPYLTILLWELSVLLLGGEVGIEEPIDLLKAIPIGTFAFLLFGLPLLILSSVFAILDVWSRHLVERVEPEALRLACPDLADVLVGGKATQGLEPSGEVVGGEEVA